MGFDDKVKYLGRITHRQHQLFFVVDVGYCLYHDSTESLVFYVFELDDFLVREEVEGSCDNCMKPDECISIAVWEPYFGMSDSGARAIRKEVYETLFEKYGSTTPLRVLADRSKSQVSFCRDCVDTIKSEISDRAVEYSDVVVSRSL